MTTPMTAAEIHALYAPLWEKVPATRPGTIAYHTGWPGPRFEWSGAQDFGSVVYRTADDSAALALCRMRCIEWLIGAEFDIEIGTDCDRVWVGFCKVGNEYEDGRSGPTLDHALVAACLAVAKEGK